MIVPDLTMVDITSYDEVMKLLQKGKQNRVVASNNINEYSSRSHLYKINL